MHVTARVDYSLHVMLALGQAGTEPVPVTQLAEALDLPYHYLLTVANGLRKAGLVRHQRGSERGILLARPATDITLDEIIWAMDGPLTVKDGTQIGAASLSTSAEYLPTLWFAAHRAMLEVFAQIRLADAINERVPEKVASLLPSY